jgi:predicted metal-dependent HD superfamily phosphohydrolase
MHNINPKTINSISKSFILALKAVGFKLTDNNKNNYMKLFDNIINRYSEPHRHYHNIDHIGHVLNKLITNNPEVVLAAIYHDIIYVPGSSMNEYCSAQLCANHLSLFGIKSSTIFKISKHILSTEQHISIDLFGNEELLDADMSILASSKPIFNKYCQDIRLEYLNINDCEFKSQRSRWALELLGRVKIFYKAKELESFARKNLRTLTNI